MVTVAAQNRGLRQTILERWEINGRKLGDCTVEEGRVEAERLSLKGKYLSILLEGFSPISIIREVLDDGEIARRTAVAARNGQSFEAANNQEAGRAA